MNLDQIRKKQKEVAAQMESGVKEKKEYTPDPRSWYPKLNEDGTSTSIIRFLPQSPAMLEAGLSKPWVTEYRHNWQGKKGWFNELCPSTFGEQCPQCDDNQENWAENEDGIRKAGKLRRTNNYFNILVIDDKATPENNGLNKFFRTGAELLKMIEKASKADPEDEDSVVKRPFDLDDGHDFVLKTTRNKFKQIEYTLSKFKERGRPVATTDEGIQEIWAKCIDLREFVDQKNLKSYDDLQARMNHVAGGGETAAPRASSTTTSTRSQPSEKLAEQVVDEDYLRSLAEQPDEN